LWLWRIKICEKGITISTPHTLAPCREVQSFPYCHLRYVQIILANISSSFLRYKFIKSITIVRNTSCDLLKVSILAFRLITRGIIYPSNLCFASKYWWSSALWKCVLNTLSMMKYKHVRCIHFYHGLYWLYAYLSMMWILSLYNLYLFYDLHDE